MRRTHLKRAVTGVVLTVLIAVVALAVVRSLITPAGEPGHEGAELFDVKGCAQCHYTESRDTKIGPGLEAIFEREALPVSGRPVTEENIRRQLVDPFKSMPSYADRLTEEEMELLVRYLKGL